MTRRRFKSLEDLRRFLADCMNRLESGDLDEAGVKSRAYVCNIMSGIIKDADLETRVRALEERLNGKIAK